MKEKIFFQNSKGYKLAANLILPSEGYKGKLVVIAHGFNSSKEGTAAQFAELLIGKGIGSFAIDFYGHGESEGDFADITVSEGVDDILSAINYLSENGFEDISLIGTSYGGQCSILAAARTDKLTSLGLRCPVTDFYLRELATKSKESIEEWEKTGFSVKKYVDNKGNETGVKLSFWEDAMTLNGFVEARSIKIPTFIVHGDQDTTVPIEQSEMLVKVVKNSELKIIENADHKFSDPELKKVALESVVDFICKN